MPVRPPRSTNLLPFWNVLSRPRRSSHRQQDAHIALIDIDWLKSINSRHGLDVGELVLQTRCIPVL
jgi:GGDEF domain-containing protein